MLINSRTNNRELSLRIVLNDEFFYFIFTVWYIGELLFNTSAKTIFGIDVGILNNVVSWMVLGLLIIQIIFLQQYELNTLIIIGIISVFVIISVVLSGSRFIISTWLFVVASMYADFDKVIRIAEKILLIGIPAVIIAFAFGLLDDYTIYRNGSLLRHSLGFIHPNQLGLRIFQLVLCILYLDRRTLELKHYIIVLLATIFCYVIPNSQTATIMLIVLFVLLLFYKIIDLYYQKRNPIYTMGLIIGASLANILSLLLSIGDISSNALLKMIDLALSIRFSAGHKVYEMYGVTLFGNRIYVSTEERKMAGLSLSSRYWLDNSYMYMLLRYGAITFFIFSVLYIFSMYYFRKKEESIIVIILFLYSIYGIMETGLFQIQHNVFLLLLGYVLYDRKHAFDMHEE